MMRESATQRNRGPALANKVIVLNPDGEDALIYDVAVRTEGRLLALVHRFLNAWYFK